MKIALVTCRQFPDLPRDDHILVEKLTERGLEPIPAVWDDEGEDWSRYDLCLLRAPWDYFRHLGPFRNWLTLVHRESDLWNPRKLVLWNLDKGYLKDLEELGFPIVPTSWSYPHLHLLWDSFAEDKGWDQVVVKPAVSAGSHETYLVDGDDLGRWSRDHRDLIENHTVLVQPLMKSVQSRGETSHIFIHENHSHSLIKRPKSGDFRSQEEYGGRLEKVESPDERELEIARGILANLDPMPIYSRIDFLWDDEDNPCLVELEIIEPSLYFDYGPEGASELARVVDEIVREGRTGGQ